MKGINIVGLSRTSLTNLNSGEGGSNLVDVKRYLIDNVSYPYVSGQAMRHYLKDAVRKLSDDHSCVPNSNGESCGQVAECEICDMFGFMTTIKDVGARTRVSPVKVSPAMGLFPLDENSTLDLLTRQKRGEEGRKSGGDMVNVELGVNLYRYGLSIDLERIGATEKIAEHEMLKEILNIEPVIPENQKIKRVEHVLKAVLHMTDFSKQARLLTDFTPDIILISLDSVFNHRLQKAVEIEEGSIILERLLMIIKDMQAEGSEILFGAIPGSASNLDDIKSALEELGIQQVSVREAVAQAINKLR